MALIDDKRGLTQTALLLLAIANRGDEADMEVASSIVSGFINETDIVRKYWGDVVKLEELLPKD